MIDSTVSLAIPRDELPTANVSINNNINPYPTGYQAVKLTLKCTVYHK